ncbi:MAG TPA: hypothetical protein VJ508_16370, partial [Saprospiraceae bacterium]|nr:hypothetical protein [Saprospiraceae bacterium]
MYSLVITSISLAQYQQGFSMEVQFAGLKTIADTCSQKSWPFGTERAYAAECLECIPALPVLAYVKAIHLVFI